MSGSTDAIPAFAGPAITALGLAAARAVESSRADRLIDDPLALTLFEAAPNQLPMLTSWPRPSDHPAPEQALHLHGSRYIGLRSRFYDDLLRAASGNGVRQGVLLGAGLDTRAYRLELPGEFELFELDQGALLEWKRNVLDRCGAGPRCRLHGVGIDLREDWAAALLTAGFDRRRPAVFIAEGLLPYLDPPGQRTLLGEIDRLAAAGSRLGCDRIAGDPHARGRLRELSRRSGIDMSELIAQGEAEDLQELLTGGRWDAEQTPLSELGRRYQRDLSDPFAVPGASSPAEPPWLETTFLVGRLAQ